MIVLLVYKRLKLWTQMHPIAINRLALSPSHHGKAPIKTWHTAKKPQKHITKAQIVLIQALIY